MVNWRYTSVNKMDLRTKFFLWRHASSYDNPPPHMQNVYITTIKHLKCCDVICSALLLRTLAECPTCTLKRKFSGPMFFKNSQQSLFSKHAFASPRNYQFYRQSPIHYCWGTTVVFWPFANNLLHTALYFEYLNILPFNIFSHSALYCTIHCSAHSIGQPEWLSLECINWISHRFM